MLATDPLAQPWHPPAHPVQAYERKKIALQSAPKRAGGGELPLVVGHYWQKKNHTILQTMFAMVRGRGAMFFTCVESSCTTLIPLVNNSPRILEVGQVVFHDSCCKFSSICSTGLHPRATLPWQCDKAVTKNMQQQVQNRLFVVLKLSIKYIIIYILYLYYTYYIYYII